MNKVKNKNKTSELKAKIQALISRTVAENESQKQRLNFLFRKLDEAKELETFEKLKEYEGGKYLSAFLAYKSLCRANYQTEHLKLTNYTKQTEYLEVINSDIEEFAKKYDLPQEQLSNKELLTMLGERIAIGEIKVNKNNEYFYTGTEETRQETKVFFKTEKTEPNQQEKVKEATDHEVTN